MNLKIRKGKQKSSVKVVLYGVEAIGKTTLAAQFPKPLILDTEDGCKNIDCHSVCVNTWQDLEGAVLELARNSQGYKTVVIDSADWAERLLIENLLTQHSKRSIEDFGFGKGYTMLAEKAAKFLANCDALVKKHLNVVFIGHSKVVRNSPPDQVDGFDRYELKLTKQVAPLFKEWCDALLFCSYKTKLVEGSDGRMKARGGKERLIYAERSAAWDAKNRFGLPEQLPMEIGSLKPLFENSVSVFDAAEQAIQNAKTLAELEAMKAGVEKRESEGTLTSSEAGTLRQAIEKTCTTLTS
tara:strand:- start:1710 stop:2600 length:891 start_codon:yes stop_codon:yes gene_type:complete